MMAYQLKFCIRIRIRFTGRVIQGALHKARYPGHAIPAAYTGRVFQGTLYRASYGAHYTGRVKQGRFTDTT